MTKHSPTSSLITTLAVFSVAIPSSEVVNEMSPVSRVCRAILLKGKLIMIVPEGMSLVSLRSSDSNVISSVGGEEGKEEGREGREGGRGREGGGRGRYVGRKGGKEGGREGREEGGGREGGGRGR